jgi:hypothetical protein
LVRQLQETNSELQETNSELQERNRELQESLEIAIQTLGLQAEAIQNLKDEIATLKGQKSRPKIPPSALEGAQSKENDEDNKQKNRSRGKYPRRKKTGNLQIHAKKCIKPELIPPGAIFKGYQKFTVQDIILQPFNTVYELERWQLSDGTYIVGKLPENIHGHYGPQVISFILHQYHACRVTQPLLLAQLREIGILISEGQLNNILIQHKEAFHQEKNELLPAGIAATGQIKVDDTGARHGGQNGYSTVVGNEFFTYIVSTGSKSRINFLEILHGGISPKYLIDDNTSDYIETMSPSSWLKGYLFLRGQGQSLDKVGWVKFLLEANIKAEKDVKLVTEAALFANLIANGIPKDLGVHGDDAGQFNVFVRSLCWVHEERHYRKLIPSSEKMRLAIEEVRGEIWVIYRGLQQYQRMPSEQLKIKLEQQFDNLFSKKQTVSPTLNHLLQKTYAKKKRLLKVLERPTTPLHNNGCETDAREMVIKRKVSGGTRSAEGQKCRDTFASLKKTCMKLGINFLRYLKDRVNASYEIPRLREEISARVKYMPEQPAGP